MTEPAAARRPAAAAREGGAAALDPDGGTANPGGRGDGAGARGLEARLLTERKKLALVQEISRALSSTLDLDELLALIMEKVTLLMEADRSTLYLMADGGDELWSKITQGGEVKEIRLRVGEGVAGWVAASGQTVNVPDAYSDARFQPAVDIQSGYRTRSILCTPMCNTFGATVGVLQVLNKEGGGPFTGEDEELLKALASQAAVSVENSKLYQSVVGKNVELVTAQNELQQRTDELNILYEIEKETNAAHDLDELLERILERAVAIVGARAGSIALCENDSLRFRTTYGPLAERLLHKRIAIGDGLIGWSVEHREALASNDPLADPRHAAEFANDLGAAPASLACAPLIAADEVLGAIELLDRTPGERDEACRGFTNSDIVLLTLIAGQASRAIQLARSKQEREKQDRLASIGQMLAGVLHDLKTPMTIISGYAQLMAQIDDPKKRDQYVEQILRQFDLMSGMAREVLAFARGEANILYRKVYLNRFLAEVERQLTHALRGRRVALVVDSRYSGVAYFDEQKILRLIQNLANNAADAMGEGGQFRISSRADDEFLYFEFSDTGPGIPPKLEGRVFELFSSGREGGTGLGLAIVKKIVEEHEGSIWYESRPGEGTTFHVKLALERPPNASPDAEVTGEVCKIIP